MHLHLFKIQCGLLTLSLKQIILDFSDSMKLFFTKFLFVNKNCICLVLEKSPLVDEVFLAKTSYIFEYGNVHILRKSTLKGRGSGSGKCYEMLRRGMGWSPKITLYIHITHETKTSTSLFCRKAENVCSASFFISKAKQVSKTQTKITVVLEEKLIES